MREVGGASYRDVLMSLSRLIRIQSMNISEYHANETTAFTMRTAPVGHFDSKYLQSLFLCGWHAVEVRVGSDHGV